MADKEKEKEKDKEQEKDAQKGGSKLPWILLGVVALASVGGMGFLFMMIKKQGAQDNKEKASEASKPTPIIHGMGPLFPMDTLIVNLDEPGGNRYLKIGFDMELTEELDPESKNLVPRLRDKVLVYLSSLTVEEIQKTKTKLTIKKKIVKLANTIFKRDVVKDVYFKSLVMQ